MQIRHKITGAVLWEDKTITHLRNTDLSNTDLRNANLSNTDLRYANLSYADLSNTHLSNANLSYANLRNADLSNANLRNANLNYANLNYADLRYANLSYANLRYANLSNTDLSNTDLSYANLSNANGLVKIIGVEHGNIYWKAIDYNLINNNYQFKLGINTLKDGEIFADNECILCSYPGFHFASKSWCKLNYGDRPYLCKIRIPIDAKINEPWATDGKASADKIEILAVYDMKTEKDVTEQFSEH